MALMSSSRRLFFPSRSVLSANKQVVKCIHSGLAGRDVPTDSARNRSPVVARGTEHARAATQHGPARFSTTPRTEFSHSRPALMFGHGVAILTARALFARGPQMRFKSDDRPGMGDEVFAFQSSRVVINVTKGEKMTEVSYERKKAMEVLFIDEEGTKTTMTLEQVVKLADLQKLDPVMVAPDADVPVIKLMDFRKERHRMLKKAKEATKNSSTAGLKEVRLGLNVGKSDLDRLMKQAAGFLEKGHRVKLFMRLKGKDFYTSQDQASDLLAKMATSLEDYGSVENPAELVGRSTNIFLSPLSRKKKGEKGGKDDGAKDAEGKEKKGKKDKNEKKVEKDQAL